MPGKLVYEFGPYRLDPVARLLVREETVVPITPKALDILTILVRGHGQLFGKDELMSKVWPDTFVEEGNLTQNISLLRKALGTDGDGQTYIETIPKRGYRFAAPVREVDLEEPPAEMIPPARLRFTRRWAVAVLALACAAVAAAVYVNGSRGPEIHSLAVLHLANASGSADQEYLSDGITEALTADLGRIAGLRVISHSSVEQYKTQRKPLKQIGKELRVDAVLEGAVQRSGGRVRATVRLIEAASERQLWSGEYNREIGALPALQAQLVREIARKLSTGSAGLKPADIQPVSSEAYDLYLRGVFLVTRGNEADNLASIGLLEKAVAIDPAFPASHAYLARAYIGRINAYAPEEQRLWESKAYAAIERALTLDPDSPEAYYARGMFQWSVTNHFRHDEAISDMVHAIALRPSFDVAHRQLAQFYLHVGLLDEALAHARQATLINPVATAPRLSTALTLSFEGRYEEAVPTLLEVRDYFPSFSGGQLAWALFQLGRKDEASLRAAEALEKDPDDNGGILSSVQALIAADAGQHRLAEAKIRTALQAKHTELYHHGTYFVACAYARMNRTNEALRWLQYTVEDGFPCYPLFRSDPNLNALRSDPRFTKLLDDMKKDWDRRSALARQTP